MKKKRTVKRLGGSTESPVRSKRVKCACASCVCTVDVRRALRRGNLLFCGQACAAKACTVEQCACEHGDCKF